MKEVTIGLLLIVSVAISAYMIGDVVMQFTYPKRYGKPDKLEKFFAGIVFILIVTLVGLLSYVVGDMLIR